MRRILHTVLLLLGLCSGAATLCLSQEMATPPKLQFKLLSRILTFDRSINTQRGNVLVIGILYQGGVVSSVDAGTEFLDEALHYDSSATGLSIRCVGIDVGTVRDIAAAIRKESVDLLYVTPLRSIDIGTIGEVSARLKILTFTGVPEYTETGVAVGLDLKGGRPEIIINLPQAKREGADFDSQFLKVARIIR
jgi:hypothetical protein